MRAGVLQMNRYDDNCFIVRSCISKKGLRCRNLGSNACCVSLPAWVYRGEKPRVNQSRNLSMLRRTRLFLWSCSQYFAIGSISCWSVGVA